MSDFELAYRPQFERVVAATAQQRAYVRAALDAGTDPEPDTARSAAFAARRARALGTSQVPAAAESVQGTDDRQAAWFLPVGSQARRAVAIVRVTIGNEYDQGSGFLISSGLFITNFHVLDTVEKARAARVEFDYEVDANGNAVATTSFRLDPDTCAIFSDLNGGLDYAVIALGDRIEGVVPMGDLRFLILSNSGDRHKRGMSANIIEHPNGAYKQIAVRNATVVAETETALLYSSDTDHGSSGSPVLNDEWQVIALHHFGEPFESKTDEDGKAIDPMLNEGIRISSIYDDLAAKLPSLSEPAAGLVREALGFAELQARAAATGGPQLTPPGHGAESFQSVITATAGIPTNTIPIEPERGSAMSEESGETTITVPLQITVRLGTGGGGSSAEVAPAARQGTGATPQAELRGPTLAESVEMDLDYSDRKGYDPHFLADVELPLPVYENAADLVTFGAGNDQTELKYTHYSVVLRASKKLACFTATNIDGATAISVDRASGSAKGAEDETWFVDPRVPKDAVPGDAFYTKWSVYFDRGHLTRREDACWGADKKEIEKGNADTFHFTNCSPQHYLFNERAQYWQGAERYVLENGVRKDQNKICVFQGPIFGTEDRRTVDDGFQIPSKFFKLIVWKGGTDGKLKSVSLIVDQSALLSIKRGGGGATTTTAFDISQYRVAIEEIQKETGLTFAPQIVAADTFELPKAPVAGEALTAVALRSQHDVLPASARVT